MREQERERRRREEETRKAEVEKARQREAEREIIKERELGNKQDPSQKQRERGQRMSTQQGQRRSLRQQGIASDSVSLSDSGTVYKMESSYIFFTKDDRGSSHSATDTEEAAVVTTAVDSTQAPGQAGSDLQATESGSDREGGRRNQEKKKGTASKRGRRSRKSAVSRRNITVETAKRETVNEMGDEERASVPEVNMMSTEGERLVGEGGGGGGRVASTNLYSPEAPAETSPLRDTIKLGPVR